MSANRPSAARRSRLIAFAIVAASGLGCDHAKSLNPNEPALDALPVGVCAYNAFAPGGGNKRIVNTFGSAADDRVFSEEVAIQKQWYSGITSTYLIMQEDSEDQANALASSNGYVLFGRYMYQRTITKYGGLAISGVLAHEGGHRVQQTLGWSQFPVVVSELEADAFSGFYMAIVKRYAWSQIQGYFANTYAAGDYYFNSPNFHGTPNQRLAAAYMGVNLAVYALSQPRPPSYAEMHDVFMSQMAPILANPSISMTNTAVRVAPSAMRAVVESLPLAAMARGQTLGAEVRLPSNEMSPRRWTSPRIR